MPGFVVPLTSDPNYKFSINISGGLFIFKIQFNKTLQLYTLSLFDQDENPIFTGRAIVLGSSDLFRGVSPDIFPGVLFAWDLTETHTELDRDNVRISAEMFYVEPL